MSQAVEMDEACAWDEIASQEYNAWLDEQDRISLAFRLAQDNKEPQDGQ